MQRRQKPPADSRYFSPSPPNVLLWWRFLFEAEVKSVNDTELVTFFGDLPLMRVIREQGGRYATTGE